MFKHRFAVLAFAVLSIFGTANAQENGIVQQYVDSPDLPDEIAFSLFMSFTNSDGALPGIENVLVGRALNLDANISEELIQIEEYVVYFKGLAQEIELDRAKMNQAELCTADRNTRSPEAAIAAMNQTDVVHQVAWQNGYQKAIAHLDERSRTEFIRYLDKLKLSSSWTQVDASRIYNQEDGRDVYSDTERWCARIENKLAAQTGGVQ